MKRIVSAVVFAALVAAVLAVAAVAATHKADANGKKSITLRLVEKDVGFNFVDNPPRQGDDAPPTIADQFAFTADLLTRAGAHAGIFGASCTVARGGVNGKLVCFGGYSLKGGLISGIAMPGDGDTHVAITGGTGAYEGVTGSATVSRGDNSPLTDVTIHLIYP